MFSESEEDAQMGSTPVDANTVDVAKKSTFFGLMSQNSVQVQVPHIKLTVKSPHHAGGGAAGSDYINEQPYSILKKVHTDSKEQTPGNNTQRSVSFKGKST